MLGVVAALGAADSLLAPVLVLAGNDPSVLIQEPPENWIALSKRTLLQECQGGVGRGSFGIRGRCQSGAGRRAGGGFPVSVFSN